MKNFIYTFLLFPITIGMFPACLVAQDGILDSTFGINGVVVTDINGFDNFVTSSAFQNDGKILVTGIINNGPVKDFIVARYNINGFLDSTFGVNGIVTTDVNGFNDVSTAISTQSNGKILVSGNSGNGINDDFSVVRYNNNGSLDNSFGINGKVITPIGTMHDRSFNILVQQDDKFIVTGNIENGLDNDFALVRYNSNGSVDSLFGLNGVVITDYFGFNDYAKSSTLQNDGKILVVGYNKHSSGFGNEKIMMTRYNTDGTIDSTFGINGIVITELYNSYFYTFPNDIKVQPNGKILVTGYTHTSSTIPQAFLVRYNSNGSQDTPFFLDPIISSSNISPMSGTSIAVQVDGKIIVSSMQLGPPSTFLMNRKDTTGLNIDTTFGNSGIVETIIGTNSNVVNILIQNDGKIILIGNTFNSANNTGHNFALTRYTNPSISVEIETNDSLTDFYSTIYPNPSNGLFEMTIDTPFQEANLTIFDVTGKVIVQQKITQNNTQLNLSAYPKGMYFYQLLVDGKQVTGKLIVQ